MTLDEFLEKLRETDREWSLGPHTGRLRDMGGTRCPLEYVGFRLGVACRSDGWQQAARGLGLPFVAAAQIVKAADNTSDHDPALRKALLDACGLEEGCRWNHGRPRIEVAPSKGEET